MNYKCTKSKFGWGFVHTALGDAPQPRSQKLGWVPHPISIGVSIFSSAGSLSETFRRVCEFYILYIFAVIIKYQDTINIH